MRAIVGVQRITSGSLTVLDHPAGTAELRKRVAYTTQTPAFYADLSIVENLQFFARVLGVGRDQIDRVLATVALSPLAHRVVATLSGGEQSRVSLAIALLADAEMLILDEPTVGLDPLLRIDLWQQFRAIADGGVTLLVSSHVLDEAVHCDNLILMRSGTIVATGSPKELCERTGTESVEEAFVSIVRERERTP
jgi:ABC-2 type transport system ATP-binding protein